MKAEKLTNMYGISVERKNDKQPEIGYRSMSSLFELFKTSTKAAILEEMGLDVEVEGDAFIFTIDESKYKVESKDMDGSFLKGGYKVIGTKIE